jgi:hypothetical protein
MENGTGHHLRSNCLISGRVSSKSRPSVRRAGM